MIQSSSKEKIKDLLRKGIGLPCMKRVYGFQISEITNVDKDEEQNRLCSNKGKGGLQNRGLRQENRQSGRSFKKGNPY